MGTDGETMKALMPQARFWRGRVVPAAVGLAVVVVAGCTLDTSTGASTPGRPCSADAHCDDKNPCTTDQCGVESDCVNTPGPDLVPVDANHCTIDACTNGVPSHAPVPDGTACLNTGSCQAGQCVVT